MMHPESMGAFARIGRGLLGMLKVIGAVTTVLAMFSFAGALDHKEWQAKVWVWLGISGWIGACIWGAWWIGGQ